VGCRYVSSLYRRAEQFKCLYLVMIAVRNIMTLQLPTYGMGGRLLPFLDSFGTSDSQPDIITQ
jgi:hypothetical protein